MAGEREQLKRLEVFSEIRPQVFQQSQNLQTLQQLEPQIHQAQTKFNELVQILKRDKTISTRRTRAQTDTRF